MVITTHLRANITHNSSSVRLSFTCSSLNTSLHSGDSYKLSKMMKAVTGMNIYIAVERMEHLITVAITQQKNTFHLHIHYLLPSTHCFIEFFQLNAELLNVVHQNTSCFSLVTPSTEFFDNFISILKQDILYSLQRTKNNLLFPVLFTPAHCH